MNGAPTVITAETLETVNEIIRQICQTVNLVILTQRLIESGDAVERQHISESILVLVQNQPQRRPMSLPETDDDDGFGNQSHRRW